MLTATIAIEQHPSDADRELALAVINRCIPVFADGMHKASLPTLREEAQRLEGLPRSPVITSMRAIVDTELAERAAS